MRLAAAFSVLLEWELKQVAQKKEQPFHPWQELNGQPGLESAVQPGPRAQNGKRTTLRRLEDKVALITGGDSEIGRAVAIAFAHEGADVAIVYRNEHEDAEETKRLVASERRRCLTVAGDVGDETFCKTAIEATIQEFGRLDILVNNSAEQNPREKIEDISAGQIEQTFRTSILSFFYMTEAALEHLSEGSSIINTASMNGYWDCSDVDDPDPVDYSAIKDAIVVFTRSLAKALAQRNIRVNAIAFGPIAAHRALSTYLPEKVGPAKMDTTSVRSSEPAEVAPNYVFLASGDGAYFTGQVLNPNSGEVVNA